MILRPGRLRGSVLAIVAAVGVVSMIGPGCTEKPGGEATWRVMPPGVTPVLGDSIGFSGVAPDLLNLDYGAVRKRLTNVGALRPEVAGYQETRSTVQALGHAGNLECNFRGDTVYSYYIYLNDIDSATVAEAYRLLEGELSRRYGGKTHVESDEEGKKLFSTWCQGNTGVVLSKTLESNPGQVSWGFQYGCP